MSRKEYDRRYKFSLESIKTEIEKCEVVCSNCHRKRTHERRNSLRS